MNKFKNPFSIFFLGLVFSTYAIAEDSIDTSTLGCLSVSDEFTGESSGVSWNAKTLADAEKAAMGNAVAGALDDAIAQAKTNLTCADGCKKIGAPQPLETEIITNKVTESGQARGVSWARAIVACMMTGHYTELQCKYYVSSGTFWAIAEATVKSKIIQQCIPEEKPTPIGAGEI